MATYVPIPDELASAMCMEMTMKEAEDPVPVTDPAFQRTFNCPTHNQTMYFDDLGYTGLMMIGNDKWEIRLVNFVKTWVKTTLPTS